MMTENLELLEKTLYQIKALLKQPDFLIFEETKSSCLEKLRIEQEKMNPGRPNTAALNEAIAKKDWGETKIEWMLKVQNSFKWFTNSLSLFLKWNKL